MMVSLDGAKHGRTAQEAKATLQSLTDLRPVAAVVLGSGVDLLEGLQDAVSISFKDLFGISPQVEGHSGKVTIGVLDYEGVKKPVAVFRGRFHLYEGHPWQAVTLAASCVVACGIPNMILTNAAGGLNLDFNVGDLMVLTGYRDHLSPEWRQNGLVGAVMQEPTDCKNALTEKLIALGQTLHQNDKGFRALRTGVYAGLLGPSYETMAEVEMLRRLKADAVGMSTVPELLTCQGTQTQACAVSVITNVWKPDEAMGGHEEVLEASKAASKRLDKLFREAIITL